MKRILLALPFLLAPAAGMAQGTCRPGATVLIDKGNAATDKERYHEAEPLFAEALRQCRAAGDPGGISASLLGYGQTLDVLNRYAESEKVLLEGWALRQQIDGGAHPDGDPGHERMYYPSELMYLYRQSSRFDLAWQWGEVALKAKAQVVGATSSAYGTTLSNMSGIALLTREYARGLQYAKQAMDIWEKTSGTGSTDHAWGMRDVGVLLLRQGNLPESFTYLERAYRIRLAAFGADATETQTSTRDMANWYTAAGMDAAALGFANAVVASATRHDGADSPAVSYALAQASSIHLRLGEAETAALEAERALAIRRAALGERNAQTVAAWQAVAQTQLANNRLGRSAQAAQAALDACAVMPGAVPASCVAHQVNHARAMLALGQPEGALQDAQRAAAAAGATGEMGADERAAGMLAAQALRALGRQPEAEAVLTALVQRAAGARDLNADGLQEARLALLAVRADGTTDATLLTTLAHEGAALAQAVADARGRAHPAHASALLATAVINMRGVDAALAHRQNARALAIALANGATLLQAHAAAQLGAPATGADAIFMGKLAVNALQAARTNIVMLPVEQQHSFVHLQHAAYQQLVDRLLDQRRIGEAETVMAMIEDNEFHDLLRGAADALDKRTGSVAYFGAERAAQEHVDAHAQTLSRMVRALARAREHLAQGTPEAPAELTTAQAAIAVALDAATAVFDTPFFGATATSSSNSVPVARPTALATGELRLTYLVGEHHVRIVVQQGAVARVATVKIAESALVRHIALLRRLAQDPDQDPRAEAQQLYALLLGPVVQELAHARSLTVSLGGVLRYLPFAILHDGRRWLVERLPMQVAGAASRTAAMPARPPRIALYGQSQASGDLPALPYVTRELMAVGAAAPARRIPHRSYLDASFTAVTLAQGLQEASMVHIASHFVLRPGLGDASYLLMGDGRRLSLAELADQRFRFDGLDLLTLSACETAVPAGVDASGRELAGLAWLARERGARHVLASLWRVSDQSTASLMADFYAALARGASKPQALRLAQLRQMHAAASTVIAAPRGLRLLDAPAARLSGHPFYWGGFMLLGNPSAPVPPDLPAPRTGR